MCSERFPELFSEPEAKRICDSLDYDFAEKRKKMESAAGLFGAFHKLMIRFCDGLVRMKIVKIVFGRQANDRKGADQKRLQADRKMTRSTKQSAGSFYFTEA